MSASATTAPRVGVIDYRMGNLRSVQWALDAVGAAPRWVHGPGDLEDLDALVLPGVGAFPRGMVELDAMGLTPHLQRWIERDRPFLGICLGFQMLFESSSEGAGARGLGVLPGCVTRLPDEADGVRLKVPQIGWNEVVAAADAAALAEFAGCYFYFVHAYAAPVEVPVPHLTATYGIPFCAAVARGRLWGTQFHPERSGADGLAVLKTFLKVIP